MLRKMNRRDVSLNAISSVLPVDIQYLAHMMGTGRRKVSCLQSYGLS